VAARAGRPVAGRIASGSRTRVRESDAEYALDVASPILVLDAFSLLYRAFFALPPLTTRAGEPTAGLYGLAVLLIKLLRERRPAGVVVARDLPGKTFRHERLPSYKETRVAPPSALGRQVARLGELVQAFGFPTFGVPGFEADDVLATLARELAEAGEAPMVVSGDRDALQLARAPASVLYVARGVKETLYDEAAVERRYGVGPAHVPDVIALVGDTSDNLPGVPGIGGKTAAALIRQHGGVKGILAAVDTIEPARLREALRARAGELAVWRELAELRGDLALPEGPRYARVADVDVARVRALFEELEFTSLQPRLEEALAACAPR
jgi:DNA polymerase-1